MTSIAEINDHTPIVASDGRQIGFVTRLHGADALQLTQIKNGHGFEHRIPLAWVSEVGRYVFLSKSSTYVAANWETVGVSRARAA